MVLDTLAPIFETRKLPKSTVNTLERNAFITTEETAIRYLLFKFCPSPQERQRKKIQRHICRYCRNTPLSQRASPPPDIEDVQILATEADIAGTGSACMASMAHVPRIDISARGT
ncbi:hypothetical protein J6590_038708 [Homalodisca vitripennis]|nr:hypothetical protein J6590_038708 [Homalodisca vitripennis]